jgi:hypothetical protein
MSEDKKLTKEDVRFIRALRAELNRLAVEHKERKDGTVNDQMFIGPEPLMYQFFDLDA